MAGNAGKILQNMQYIIRNKFLSGRYFPVLVRLRVLLAAAFIAGCAAGAVLTGQLPARKYSARAVLRCWQESEAAQEAAGFDSLSDFSPAVSHKQLSEFIETGFFQFNINTMQDAASPDFSDSPVTYKVRAGKVPADIVVTGYGSNAHAVGLSLTSFVKVLMRSTENNLAPWPDTVSWVVWRLGEPELSLSGYFFAGCVIAGCGGIGILLIMVIAFWYCCCDKSIHNIRQFEEDCKLPVLGVLPQITLPEGPDRLRNLSLIYRDAVCSLRDRLNWLLTGRRAGTVLQVTSLDDNNGVSYAASALALAWAKQQKRVLLVEADYRRRQQNWLFKVADNPGLSSIAGAQNRWQDVLVRNINNMPLDVLVRGNLDVPPADLLRSRAFENFLRDAAAEYDIVLLDAPTFLPYSDAMILGRLADSTLLICDYRNCSCEKIKLALWRMHKAEVNICGWMIDFFPLSKRRYHYYNYQYNFYKYQDQ